MMEAIQYSIVLTGKDLSSGTDTAGSVQCIVISPAEMNRSLRTVIVAPLGPDTGDYPTRVRIKSGNRMLRAALDQITTIESKRILRSTGEASPSEIKKIKSVLKEILVD